MRCTRCDTELIAGKSFCHACGEPAPSTCPACGAAVEDRFQFCPDCGESLAGLDPSSAEKTGAAARTAAAGPDRRLASHMPESLVAKLRQSPAAAGERKRVTILFCDLVDSTAIAENLDPELYRELLDEYLELALGEIYRFEGIVNQLAGDGMMALFGAPIAHEDAPERALRAALAIRDRLAELSVRRLDTLGRALRARIGVHTGMAVVGAVGNDLKMDYTAIGDTTNLAARLQSLAPPGSILASSATLNLAPERFRTRAVGLVEVKGRRDPVPTHEVLACA